MSILYHELREIEASKARELVRCAEVPCCTDGGLAKSSRNYYYVPETKSDW